MIMGVLIIIANTGCVFLAELNRTAYDSGNGLPEQNKEDASGGSDSTAALGEGSAGELIRILLEVKEGQSRIDGRLSRIEAKVDSLKETRDIEAHAMQDWRLKLSNDVKAIDEKLSSAEKR